MERNLLGHHHPDAVDKNIRHIDHPARPHNDIFAPPVCGGPPMNADPHGAGPKMPVHIVPSAARPKGEPAQTSVSHNPRVHDHLHSIRSDLAPVRR
jgi:hypothetical protein